jgi:hypothetical protein
VIVAVAGLSVAAFGLFGLPIQQGARSVGSAVSYVQVREVADRYPDASGTGFRASQVTEFATAFSTFWWRFGLLGALTALLVLVCILIAKAATSVSVLTIVLAVATVAGQAVALAQTHDYYRYLYLLRGYGSLYDHGSSGIWVGMTGLGIVAVGALLALPRRRPALPQPMLPT